MAAQDDGDEVVAGGTPPVPTMDNATIKVVLGLILFFAGMIGLVVVVGLFQGRLDPTGVATLLGGIFTGLVGSAVALLRRGGGGNGGGSPPTAVK